MITKLFLKVLDSSFLKKEDRTKVVDKPIYRIGREADNDWVIACPKRLISRYHCVIERINNSFTINDLSKNGVYINNSSSPIGIGNNGILNDGDILILPGLKISVCFSDTGATAEHDPFLAILPSRGEGPAKKETPHDPIIAATISQSPKVATAYDFLKDRSIAPFESPEVAPQRSFLNYSPTPQRSAFNMDRLPAEKDSFRSALPQTMTIPEDWDKEEVTLTPNNQSNIYSTRNTISEPEDTQTQLLMKLLIEFSKIDKAITNSNNSLISSLLDENRLNSINQSELNLAMQKIEDVSIKISSIIKYNQKISNNNHSSNQTKPVDATTDEAITKTIETTGQTKALNIPSTRGANDELE